MWHGYVRTIFECIEGHELISSKEQHHVCTLQDLSVFFNACLFLYPFSFYSIPLLSSKLHDLLLFIFLLCDVFALPSSIEARRTARWYSSWILFISLWPIVALYFIWIPLTLMGKLDNMIDPLVDDKKGEYKKGEYSSIDVRVCLLSNSQDGSESDDFFQNPSV